MEEVKKRIDIVDFIGRYVTLKKAGRNFKAVCPFHREKTPSFVISPDRQIWHCFGACATGGDVVSFLMKWDSLTFYEALKELAQKFGIALTKVDFEDVAWRKKERLLALNKNAAQFYQYLLTTHAVGEAGRSYLQKRGVSQKIIQTFCLGYAPSSWNSLLKYLVTKNFSPSEGVEAGVLIKSDRGTYYDRLRKRIVFPLTNANGLIIGFSGRAVGQTKGAKYINTPETMLYRKRETLYGIHLAKEAIKKKGAAVIVEGEFDMISCFMNGIIHTVAVKGSAVTHDQLLLLKRYVPKIILCLDADLAGQETTKKAIAEAEQLDFEIGVVDLSPFKDPDEAISKDVSEFKNRIAQPLPFYDFIIDTARKRNPGDDAASKKNIGDAVLPFLMTIQNPIVQSHYFKKVSELLDVEVSTLEQLMYKIKRREKIKKRTLPQRTAKDTDRFEMMQKYILHRLLQEGEQVKLFETMKTILEEKDFSIIAYQKLLHELMRFLNEYAHFDLARFIQALPSALLPIFDEVLLFEMSIFDPHAEEKTMTRSLYELKRLSLKKTLSILMKQDEIDEIVVKKHMEALSQVEKKLTIL